MSPSAGIAPGTLVEVKRTLRCEEPLASEMAERTCAYYSSTVTREYLRPDYDDDNDVGSDRRTEIIAQNVQFAPFMVEDDTGFVRVYAEGAEVDARQVVNRLDRNTSNEGPFSLGGMTVNLGGGERTIGTATPRASSLSTRRSTCSASCRMVARLGRCPAKGDTASSSATAPRKRWGRASARPFSGSAWEASEPWFSAWSYWS